MSDQLGFDFGDNIPPAFSPQAMGTWLEPEFTTAQFEQMFARADEVIQGIVGPALPLLQRGLDIARVEHARMLASRKQDSSPYRLWRTRCPVAESELDAFVDHCRQMLGAILPGIEYKLRSGRGHVTAAMHVRDAGTLTAWRWSADNYAIDFRPWRDTFFLESFHDQMPAIEAPYSLWGPAYCADKLAEADQGVASVPTFTLNGREYINDGGYSCGAYHECEGWTFCPLGDWRGTTFNYRSQCRAWDNGSLERGDRRGLVVRVRGQLCVLTGAARIYDQHARAAAYTGAVDDQAEDLAEADPDGHVVDGAAIPSDA